MPRERQSRCAVVQIDDKYRVAPASSVAPGISNIGTLFTLDEHGVEHKTENASLPPGEYHDCPHFMITGPVSYQTLVEDIDVEHREFYDLPDLQGVLADVLLDYTIGPVMNYKG